jgi:hypothetical protein
MEAKDLDKEPKRAKPFASAVQMRALVRVSWSAHGRRHPRRVRGGAIEHLVGRSSRNSPSAADSAP